VTGPTDEKNLFGGGLCRDVGVKTDHDAGELSKKQQQRKRYRLKDADRNIRITEGWEKVRNGQGPKPQRFGLEKSKKEGHDPTPVIGEGTREMEGGTN